MISPAFFRIAAFATLCIALLFDSSQGDKESQIIGLVGESADLPCDVDVSDCGKVYFITWTKNVSSGEWKRLYLYSDTVEKPLQELANPDRADFFVEESSAHLRISPLRIEDDGVYKCDVTYVKGKCPSLSFATLIMHAEPSPPVIEKDGKVAPSGSEVGPFYEGASLSLDCETSGGKPTPEVTWYKGDQELDSESKVTIEKNGASSVTSTVRLTLERKDLASEVKCSVDNEAIDDPLDTFVKIILHVGPSDLSVTGPTEPVTEGDVVPLTCIIEGAKPPAIARWFNMSEELQIEASVTEEEQDDGTFRTTSVINVPVSRHDHGGTYYCKGTNSVLQSKGEAALLKSLDLQVLFAPKITVQPSGGVLVNETDSAIIYCTYEANPFEVQNVKWYRDDEQLRVPTQGKYEASTQGYPTLFVKEVDKDDAGHYWCSLENDIGRGNASERIELSVLYPPIVKAAITPEEISEGASSSLYCYLTEGNPQNLLRVRWFKEDELLYETTEREIVWQDVTRNTSGNYSCEGENAAGWGPRSEVEELLVRFLPGPATLKELDPPAIKGESSSLQCIVDDLGLPEASVYRWEKDGSLLATTSSMNFTTDLHRLLTRGNYSCAAVNEVGVGGRGYVYLYVQAPPNFIRDLPDVQGAARDAPHINFDCHVECDPICEVHWRKGDEDIDNSDLYIIRNQGREEDGPNNRFKSIFSTLQFNMAAWPDRRLVRDRDRANYTCYSTSNSAGEGVSSTVLFQVEYPPEHMRLSDSQVDVKEGEVPESVDCWASSWPPSTYMWKKGNMVLALDDTLVFNDTVGRDNGGIYKCVAENRHGKAQIEMKLNVLYKPECTITESRDEDGDKILVCTADGNPSFINFTWIKDNETLDSDDYDIEYEGSRSTFGLPHDYEDRLGHYSCIAVNDIGDSDPCEKLLDGPGLAGWHGEFGDKNALVLAAVIGGIAILFVLIIIIIIIIMRKRRLTGGASPGKPVLAPGDNLYQNVSGGTADKKQNGPPVSDTEGNVMYENMPFHRQGPNPSFSTGRMRQSLPADFSHSYQNLPYCRQEWGIQGPGKGNGHCGGGQQQQQQQQRTFHRSDHPRFTDPLRQQQQQIPPTREPCPQHGLREPEIRSWGRASSRENGSTGQVEMSECSHLRGPGAAGSQRHEPPREASFEQHRIRDPQIPQSQQATRLTNRAVVTR